jgi:hypothetical protein
MRKVTVPADDILTSVTAGQATTEDSLGTSP